MAAFLNKPSDFTAKSADRESPVQLIPPSQFEKSRARGNEFLQEHKKTSEEILALKQENQKLRDRLLALDTSESSPQASSNTSRSMHTDERRYADELISRQANEIMKLKAQTQQLECEKQAAVEKYEKKLADLKSEHSQMVSELCAKMRMHEDEYHQQLHHLQVEREKEQDILYTRIQGLVSDLETTREQLTSQVNNLTRELQDMQEESRAKEEELEESIREKDTALQSALQQVQQLRTYITESEQQHRPQQVWQKEFEALNNELKIVQCEKEALQESVQLMEVRLSSMKEILSTQETELSKGKEEIIDKNKLKELLLTSWRQKVYALLVQQKSSEIVSKKDLQNWQEKTSMLEDRLSSAQNTLSILQHTVAEREAEIKLGATSSRKLQEEFKQAQQVALSLDGRLTENRDTVQRLADFAQGLEKRFEPQSQVLQQAFGQLKSLGQRVSFASSRMELVKSQLARREALKQLEQKQAEKEKADLDTEESWRVERDQLVQELERVSHERDLLATQLRHDSETWAEKVSSMRSQYDSEVSSLKRAVEDLELVNQEKSRTIEQFAEEIEERQSELKETTERVEKLRTELARHEHTMTQALEDQKKQLEEGWTEHMAEMERKLNDARREHTKAVVTVRQQERQMGREKERMQELQATMEAHFHAQLGHLQHQLQAVERERNIFMATLRQEGLLGRLKSERGEPIRLHPQDEVEEIVASNSVTEVTEINSQPPHDSSEPVSAVLEDLKALAPAVFDNSLDESSDENQ